MLSDFQRERLKAQVRPKIDEQYQHTDNPLLNVVVAELRQQSPECFHTNETLAERVFYNQPKDHVENAGYIVPRIPVAA